MKKTIIASLMSLTLAGVMFFASTTTVFALGSVTVTNATEGVVFEGTGFSGVAEVDVLVNRTDGLSSHSSGEITVTGGSFTYVDLTATSGTSYTYQVNNTATSASVYTGSFTAGAPVDPDVIDPGDGVIVDPGDGEIIDTGPASDGGISDINFSIPNPVRGFDNLPDLIVALLEIVMLIATPIIAIMLIYTGYLFVTAKGDIKKVGEARDTLLYAVIGAAIILGAEIIAKAIQGTVSSLL
jgi:hypothetical protein